MVKSAHHLLQWKNILYISVAIVVVTLFYIESPIFAQSSLVQPSFDKKEIKAKKNSTIEVNLYLESSQEDKLSGASVFVKYPSKILEYSENLSAQPNTECKNSNYKLTQLLATKNDPKAGVVRITKVQIAADDALPSGKFCFGTLKFTTKPSFWFILPWFSRNGDISMNEPGKWEIVGPKRSYKIPETATNTILKVTETN